MFITVATLFNGLLFFVGKLPGNPFLNMFYASVIDIFAYLSAYVITKKFGRRTILCGSFAVSTLSLGVCVPMILTNTGVGYTRWLAFMAKIGGTFIYQVVYLLAAELFPTPIRSMALSLCMAFGTLGGFVSPFITELNPSWAPYATFGSIALVGSILSILIPETKGIGLMETIDEAIAFHQKAYSIHD